MRIDKISKNANVLQVRTDKKKRLCIVKPQNVKIFLMKQEL